MYKLYNGDCMQVMKELKSESIDLILTDIPYGTMKGIDDAHDWDTVLPIGPMFSECTRLLRFGGRCVLFSQEPLTSQLITQAPPALPFAYRAIWKKNTPGNCLSCRSAMVALYEDINIFNKPFKKYDYEGENPLRAYFAQVLEYIGRGPTAGALARGKKLVREKIGGPADHTCRTESSQFALCTENIYNKIIQLFNIDKMDGFRPYKELRTVQDDFNNNYCQKGYRDAVFNLWQGGQSKSNVLEYDKPAQPVHPTQKPVELLEDLIETYTNRGDTILDFTMGSGSTIEAAINTGRDVIGIELDTNYYKIAEKRAEKAAQAGARWF